VARRRCSSFPTPVRLAVRKTVGVRRETRACENAPRAPAPSHPRLDRLDRHAGARDRLNERPVDAAGLTLHVGWCRLLLTELREGWVEFTSRGWLVAVAVWAGLFHFAVLAPFQVLGPVVAESSLGGAGAWGGISAALGAGSVAGGLIALRLRVTRPMIVACVGLVTFAAPLALLAIPASTGVVAASVLFAGAGTSVFGVLFTTVMQEQIPLESLSRVSAYDWLGSLALLPVGLALVGTIADQTSPSAVLVFGAIWMAVSTLGVLGSVGVRRITSGPVNATPRDSRAET